jgi:cysteine desulfurase/selenocysteine lyase
MFKKTSNFKNLFPFFKKNPKAVYFDSAATTLKPKIVINVINNYYSSSGLSDHSSDNFLSNKIAESVNLSRKTIANFINALEHEISFVPSTTFAINYIAKVVST